MTTSRKAIIYPRRSSEKDDDRYTLTTQRDACRRYADLHGFNVVFDEGEEWTGVAHLRDRRVGAHVWSLLEAHQADALIVYTTDRLSRADLIDVLPMLGEILKLGIEVHTLDGGVISDPNDIGTIIRLWQSSDERKKIVERLMRGRREKVKSGKLMGSEIRPFWIVKTGLGRQAIFSVDAQQAKIVQDIYRLLIGSDDAPPLACRAIARELDKHGIMAPRGGHWKHSQISWLVRNGNAIGEFHWQDLTIDRPELAIVDRATHLAALAQLQKNSERAARNRKYEYLCSGHLLCHCGKNLIGWYSFHADGSRATYAYYVCNARLGDDRHYAHPRQCLPLAKVDAVVWTYAFNAIDDPKLAQVMRERKDQPADRLREQLVDVEANIELERKRIERLVAKFGQEANEVVRAAADKQIDEAKQRWQKAQKEKDIVLMQIDQRSALSHKQASILAKLKQYRTVIRSADYALKREMLESISVSAQMVRKRGKIGLRLSCDIAAEQTVWL
jgi:DNA invertase Pin-like site-specific DNA recombinase